MSITEEAQGNDFRLPDLNPLLKLYKAAAAQDGAPQWVLYYPASNKYYQIGWTEFEALARFHKYETAKDLVEAVTNETTLTLTIDDVKSLTIFLSQNGLLKPSEQIPIPKDAAKPLWKQALHGYLFFTIPIIRPQKFLDAAYPYIKGVFTKTFFLSCLVLLAFGFFLTLPRSDEFFHTFTQIFTAEGLMLVATAFFIIKIFHEFGHAFMAKHYGIPVPHMGVAFMVMYPVLYTEMSGSWRIPSSKARMMMGLAGVMTEFVLAAIFLIYWHLTPSALGQSLAFSVVAISLVGSIFVNLNPFMRYDGYYVLSDYLGIENLHQKAIAFAKHWLRWHIFGLKEERPEDVLPQRQRFLTLFGLGVIIYRFLLYLGIAVLVYHVFFKPLGLILFLVEISWFIILPILKEIKYLTGKFESIKSDKDRFIRGTFIVILLLFIVFPTGGTINTVAIVTPASYQNIYAPSPAYIEKILVENDDEVSQSQTLATLSSPLLEKNIKLSQERLKTLLDTKRREQTNPQLYRERRSLIDENIAEATQELASLKKKREQLIITAPFDGKIYDLMPDIHADRNISDTELLFRLVQKETQNNYIAYVEETNLARIERGDKATFTPAYSLSEAHPLTVTSIEQINNTDIEWPELSTTYGGPVTSISQNQQSKSTKSFYKITLTETTPSNDMPLIYRGHLKIHGKRSIPLIYYIKKFIALIIQESGVN